MVGNQFGFTYKSVEDLGGLYLNILDRLCEYYNIYDLSDDRINYIFINFIKMDASQKIIFRI